MDLYGLIVPQNNITGVIVNGVDKIQVVVFGVIAHKAIESLLKVVLLYNFYNRRIYIHSLRHTPTINQRTNKSLTSLAP